MLTKDNAVGFSPAFFYPTYRYIDKGKPSRYTAKIDGSRIIPCPEGHEEQIVHQDEDQHFAKYRESIIKEHADLSDGKLAESPPFLGGGRNARWIDAGKARGLA